jgi:hypothetical protein
MTHLKTYQAIARNRKKLIDAIFARATNGIVLSLDNGFRGTDCEPNVARKALEQFNFAKLTYQGGDKFHVSVHSNLWYEFHSPVGSE